MQFKKSILATALLSVLTLSGCNSGSSDTATSTTTINSDFPNVKMCLTSNPIACDNNGVMTNNDGIGQLVITAQDKNKTIIVETDGHTFSAPATSTFVTPITTLVVNAMKNNKNLTVTDAKNTVKDNFSEFTNKYPNINIFGNPNKNPILEKIINALEETSVKYNSVDIADLVNKAMDVSDTSVPVIQEGGSTENIEQPQLSQDAKTIKPQVLKIEDKIQPIDLTTLFTLDGDSSVLTYHVKGMPQGLTNKGNTIEGAITQAGAFTIEVIANNNGALSEPATLTFEITPVVPNTAPTVIKAGQTELQNDTDSLKLTQGESIGDDVTYTISDLFNDIDGDQLTITPTFKSTKTNTSNGITVTQKGNQLILSGTPTNADEMTLTISANDGVNAQSAKAIITLKVTAVTPNAAPTLIKAGQTELQNDADSLQLTQGEPIGDVTYPVSSLFSDTDGDSLTITPTFKSTKTNTSNGITVTQQNSDLILSGTPINADEMTLTISANDGINAQSAEATITFNIAKGVKPEPLKPDAPYVITPESIKKDFIDGKKWYMTSYLVEESSKPIIAKIVDGSHINIKDPEFGGIYTFNVDKSNSINIPKENQTFNIFYSSSNIILAGDPTEQKGPLDIWLTHPINNQIAKDLQKEQFQDNTYYYLESYPDNINVQSVTLTNENMSDSGEITLDYTTYNILEVNQKDGTILLESKQDTERDTINLNILFTNQQTAQSIANKWRTLSLK
ncbi:hypothetical protein [Photobacterium carnosum]|uniref:Dystroglycan-type cadherin-like domain-containing protein n=1 Tax=Photobacterium carnosum TaxID=2023717 RepID=A0A2N4UMN7_9GAMM|nr:hypothetical protein [Photobacterium carnosum]PLC56289.1 hypothetical protein CIK00_19105 [Photobacterium carnosum]